MVSPSIPASPGLFRGEGRSLLPASSKMASSTAATSKNLDAWLEKVQKAQYLAEEELKSLCDTVKEILVEESNVQPVNTPVTVSVSPRFGVWLAQGCGRLENPTMCVCARGRGGQHPVVKVAWSLPTTQLPGDLLCPARWHAYQTTAAQ